MASYRTFDELMSAILHDENIKKEVISKKEKINGQILREYAVELRNMINKNLRNYYNSYTPQLYERTNKLKTSIDTYPRTVHNGEQMYAVLNFNDNAWHESVDMESGHHSSFVPGLLNYGWHVKNTKVKRNNRFYYYEGSFYITNAIEEFNSMYSSHGIRASISYE